MRLSPGAQTVWAPKECRIFAREGAKVVIADVMEEEGRQVEAEIAEAGGDAVFMRLDVTNESNWEEAVEATLARYGKLDILVNNAGISGTHHPDTMSTQAWDTFMDINAKGVFLGMKSVIPQMQAAGAGSIVNISSISGIVGQNVIHMGYNASKGAVRIVTKAAAVQYAEDGIRVNSVHPGAMPPMRSSSAARDPGDAGQYGELGGADASCGACRGGRLRGALPGLQRSILHNRRRTGRGWWIHGGVKSVSPHLPS